MTFLYSQVQCCTVSHSTQYYTEGLSILPKGTLKSCIMLDNYSENITQYKMDKNLHFSNDLKTFNCQGL